MAISIIWGTRVIYVPQSYLGGGGGGVYSLDLEVFREDILDIMDDEQGIAHPDTHIHNVEVTLGGITLARTIEFINGYTVTFEDGQYAVEAKKANSNIADVMNVNQVSLRTFNSAGLIVHVEGSGVTEQDKLDIADRVWDESLTGLTHNVPTSSGRRLRQLGDVVTGVVNDGSATTIAFITTVTSAYDNFYNDQYIRFTNGNLEGIVRIVRSYNNSTLEIIVSEPLPVAPENGDEFDLIPVHIHPIDQIAEEVWAIPTGQAEEAGSIGERIKVIDDNIINILSDTSFIKDIEGGKWEIIPGLTPQMVFYKADNITEIARFDISYDDDGNPIMRERV